MKGIVHYFETEKGKRVKNLIVGVGASVVLMVLGNSLTSVWYAGT